MSISLDGRVVDVRLVTLPTVEGESVVMRILEKDERVLSFEDLGMVGDPLGPVREGDRALTRRGARHRPDRLGQVDDALLGARLDPQPREDDHHDRGSGRGPRARASSRCRSTTRPGLDFAAGLRSMMRADPDVIMVGEIRDRETATTAIESSLTGHLILSTLHTNDAASAVTRLVEMGIEPFLVASSITLRGRAAASTRSLRRLQGAGDDLRRDAARERLRRGWTTSTRTGRSAVCAAARPATAAASACSR